MNLLNFSLREIKNNKRFSFFFVLNLTLGLLGFTLIESFKISLDSNLKSRSKEILTADLSLSARRNFKPDEINSVNKILNPYLNKKSEMLEIYSMIKSKNRTRLVLIKGIEAGYPFYGQIEGNNIPIDKTNSDLIKNSNIWIYPELLAQLNVKLGDHLQLGDQKFKISKVITKDAGDMWASASMAPRAYIGKVHFNKTNLIRKGSTLFNTQYFKLNSETPIHELADQIHKSLKDPGVRVWTPENASEQLAQLLNYLNDYLSLTTLVAFFLSSIGAGFLYRSFLSKRLKDIAILNAIGAQKNQAKKIYIYQISILGFISASIATLFTQLILPFILNLSKNLIPVQIEAQWSLQILFISLFLATLGSLLICVPLLTRISSLNVNELFQEHVSPHFKFNNKTLLLYLPALFVYWLLAMWQSHSIKVGSLFTITFLFSLLLLLFIGYLFLRLLEKIKTSTITFKLAFRNLYKNKVSSLISYLALGLGALLLNIIPQLQKSIETEISTPHQSKLPGLFLFDIQSEQVPPLKVLLQKNKTQLQSLSPLVRARILKINKKDFLKGLRQGQSLTREQEKEMRFRNRGFNLTYRDQLSPSEEIIEGLEITEPYQPNSQILPKISLEQRFAERLDLKIGDQLTFDVQGIEIIGQVENLRKVRWTTFQPNFFVQFQSGVLNEAPKTFLASIPKSKVSPEIIQQEVVQNFPNISIIDVSRIVSRILTIVEKMGWALFLMATLCFIVGFIVLFSIANYQITTKKWDMNLLKILGGTHQLIKNIFSIEFLFLGLMASFTGVALSIIISSVLSYFLFDSLWVWSWKTPLMSIVALSTITLATAYWTTRQVLQQKVQFGDD